MSDLIRHDNSSTKDIIAADPALQLKALEIAIAEKTHQLDGINHRLNQLKTIEIKRLELQKDVIAKELDQLRQQATEIARAVGVKDDAVDAEFTVSEEPTS